MEHATTVSRWPKRYEWHGNGPDEEESVPISASDSLEALLLLARLIGPTPALVYHCDEDAVSVSSDRLMSIAPPLDAASASDRFEFDWERLDALRPTSSGSYRPSLFVAVRSSNASFDAVDLIAAKVTSLIGPAHASQALLGRYLRSAEERPSTLHVVAIGEVRSTALAIPATSLTEAETPGEALRALEALSAVRDLEREPTLVVVDGRFVEGEGDRLAAALSRHRAVAVVFLAGHSRAHVIVTLETDGTGEVFLRRRVVSSSRARGLPARPDSTMRSGSIEIGVLGSVQVRGADAPVDRRPKLTELISYLAMHPEGALTRSWTAALWPDRAVPAQTVANRLSEARRVLGFASDGLPRLRRNGERHRIVEITTDWSRFCELSSAEEPGQWKDALALVRGRAFEDLRHGEWLILEGFEAEIEETVARCALRFCDRDILASDPEGVTWAARQALRIAPFDERLHRLLMLAADATGNRAGVDTALRHLALLLEIDGDPLAGVHPETAALYSRLSRRVPTGSPR